MSIKSSSIYRELRDIVSRLAGKNICGRWVDVYYKVPPLKGCKGLAAREDDRGVVWVSPHLSDDEMLSTVLHEFCHIRKHYHLLKDVSGIKRLGVRHVRDIENRMPKSEENLVKGQVGKWLTMIEALRPEGGDYLQKLSSLSSHYAGVRR